MSNAHKYLGWGVSQAHHISFHGRNDHMTELLKRLWQEEEGQDLTEYALLLVLIALVAIVAVGKLGSIVNSIFQEAGNNLSSS